MKDADMRVLMVNHTGNFSGAEVALLRLIDGLDGGCECAVACPASGPLPDRLRAAGIEQHEITGTDASLHLHAVKTPKALAMLIRSAREVRTIANEIDPDVIHANGLRSGLIASLTPWRKRPPLVVQSHEHLPPGPVSTAVRRVIAARADKVIGVTERTAANFNHGLAQPIAEAVYISIDQKRFHPGSNSPSGVRAELGVPEQAFLLAQVAQITPWKGQDVAIRALREVSLAKPHREVHLLLVGEVEFESARYDNPGYAAELRRLVSEFQLQARVHFLGRRDDVPTIMDAADLTLLPSWNEPFGLVAAESMGMATPVLVSSESGVSEYVEDGVSGRLLPAGEPQSWAEAILDLMQRSPDQLAAMGERARQVAERFTDERYARDVRGVYRDAVLAASKG
jgi:glycosyltransferase involved in cell wall biosynthesis